MYARFIPRLAITIDCVYKISLIQNGQQYSLGGGGKLYNVGLMRENPPCCVLQSVLRLLRDKPICLEDGAWVLYILYVRSLGLVQTRSEAWVLSIPGVESDSCLFQEWNLGLIYSRSGVLGLVYNIPGVELKFFFILGVEGVSCLFQELSLGLLYSWNGAWILYIS